MERLEFTLLTRMSLKPDDTDDSINYYDDRDVLYLHNVRDMER
jgi:hypothetical protein